MRGNDLSNKQAPFIMFDIDSLLFVDKEKNRWTKLTDVFKSEFTKYIEREFNQDFIKLLNNVWHKHNVSIGLVSFSLLSHDEVQELEKRLDGEFAPYTRIFSFFDWDELRSFSHGMYTFSNNDELLSYLSSKNAMKLERIREVLG